MKSRSREFQIFIKPVGALCNLRCSYCYYLDKETLYSGKGSHVISADLLEKYVIQHISASTDEIIFFSWHGGEPLLAGIDFYRKAVSIQKKHLSPGRRIVNGVQTNGTLINEEWCNFFSGEGFICGISIDGPGELHNTFRHTPDRKPVADKVMNAMRLLQKYGIGTEILCVLNSQNVKYPGELYEFFLSTEVPYLTFLPLVEKTGNSSVPVTPSSVPSPEFGMFLSAVFDKWVANDIGRIKIQVIEEAARTAFGQEHTLCIFRKNCGGVPVVEHNGDFYSCDHYVDSEHLLGNIKDNPLEYYLDSKAQKDFGEIKSQTLPRYCLRCEVLEMCNGECPKNRIISTPDGEPGLNYLCEGYRSFFNHIRPFVDAVSGVSKSAGLQGPGSA